MLYRNLYIYEAWKRNSNLNPEMYKNETGKHNNNKTLQKNLGGLARRLSSEEHWWSSRGPGMVSSTHVGQLTTIS